MQQLGKIAVRHRLIDAIAVRESTRRRVEGSEPPIDNGELRGKEAQIGEKEHLGELQPVWLTGHRTLEGRGDEPARTEEYADDDHGQPELDHEAVERGIDQIVLPATAENVLFTPPKQALERH